MKFLIVVDMQNDFCTGSLANSKAVEIIPFIKEQIENARKEGTKIIYTVDTHDSNYMNTLEGKHLPIPHCIHDPKKESDGTPEGWSIVDELRPKYPAWYDPSWKEENDYDFDSEESEVVIMKTTFGFHDWTRFIPKNSEVDICGTVTSICVAANASAIKQIEGVEVNVLSKGCADLSDELQDAALKVLKAQQCNII